MKRQRQILLCGLLLCFAGCDRQTVAWLILNVGFNVRMESNHADGEVSGETVPAVPTSLLEQTSESLRELRLLNSDPRRAALELERGLELAERVIELVDLHAAQPGQDELQTATLAEAKWAALRIGARLSPAQFQQRHVAYRQEFLKNAMGISDLERKSINRYVTNFLAADQMDADAAAILRLHAATYPECNMNSQLFVTTIEQLAAREMVAEAVALAEDGIRLCEPDDQLAEQLQRLYLEHPTAVGVPMNFAGPNLKGRRLEIQSLRGSPVMVVFWATWCPACRKEAPHIQEIADRFRDDGLQVVGVSLDRNRSDLDAFITQESLSWSQIFTDDPAKAGWDNPIVKYYGVESIPYVFLLDRSGKIRARGVRGEAALSEAIVRLLDEE